MVHPKELSLNPDVEQFLAQYEARAGYSNRAYYYRRPQYNYTYHESIDVLNYHTATMEIEREPYVEVLLPKHQLERIVQYQEDAKDYVRSSRHAIESAAQQRIDERVRESNPAVQKAWTKYLMLLELARK